MRHRTMIVAILLGCSLALVASAGTAAADGGAGQERVEGQSSASTAGSTAFFGPPDPNGCRPGC